MPFGLRNALATFQRLMSTVLCGVNNSEVYLDDIVAYSSNWTEHVKTRSDIFDCLCKASLTLNLATCEFGKAVVTYFGKMVGQGRVCPVTARVQAVVDFPAPQMCRELRRFLGVAGYYRGFCNNFSDVVTPLTSLMSPKIPFQWSEKCQFAFEAIKALLCSAPVLAVPDFDLPIKLEVSVTFSKKLKQHQLHYSTIEKEALALLLALQHFKVYLGSNPKPTVVFSDHNPLVFLTRMQNSDQRLMRWSLLRQDFFLVDVNIKGLENIMADALSRS